MAATKHGLAEGHEVCDGVVAIADELDGLEVFRLSGVVGRTSCRLLAIRACADISVCLGTVTWIEHFSTHTCFRMIELDSSGQSALGKEAQLGYHELVKLYSCQDFRPLTLGIQRD